MANSASENCYYVTGMLNAMMNLMNIQTYVVGARKAMGGLGGQKKRGLGQHLHASTATTQTEQYVLHRAMGLMTCVLGTWMRTIAQSLVFLISFLMWLW